MPAARLPPATRPPAHAPKPTAGLTHSKFISREPLAPTRRRDKQAVITERRAQLGCAAVWLRAVCFPSLGLASPSIKQGLGVNQASVLPLSPPAQEELERRRDPAARAPGSIHTARPARGLCPPRAAPGAPVEDPSTEGLPPPREALTSLGERQKAFWSGPRH